MRFLLFRFKTLSILKWVLLLLAVIISSLAALDHFLIKRLSIPSTIILPVLDEQVDLFALPMQTFHTAKAQKGLLLYLTDVNTDTAIAQAKKFAELGFYVVLIDATSTNQLLEKNAANCKNFSDYFKKITQELKNHWQIDVQLPSIIIGEHQGSALAYITLAQTKTHDYHAVLSVNFEPYLNDASKPLCDFPPVPAANKIAVSVDKDSKMARSTQTLSAQEVLSASWYLFQDKNTAAHFEAMKFTDKIASARVTLAHDEKETSISLATQILQWLDPRLSDQLHVSSGAGDLPLIEIPVPKDAPDYAQPLMALIITGDGGWAEIDKNLAQHLSKNGIPTVALDSLSYFWKYRSPEETTQAIESTIKNYLQKWHKQRVLLMGYSFGADILPVVANKFSEGTQQHIALIAFLGLGKSASFEFRISSWLNADDDPNSIPLHSEIQKLSWIQPLCVYGLEDTITQCPNYEVDGVKLVSLPGDHHFDKKYDDVVAKLLENIH